MMMSGHWMGGRDMRSRLPPHYSGRLVPVICVCARTYVWTYVRACVCVHVCQECVIVFSALCLPSQTGSIWVVVQRGWPLLLPLMSSCRSSSSWHSKVTALIRWRPCRGMPSRRVNFGRSKSKSSSTTIRMKSGKACIAVHLYCTAGLDQSVHTFKSVLMHRSIFYYLKLCA